jgi:hypothetical protein
VSKSVPGEIAMDATSEPGFVEPPLLPVPPSFAPPSPLHPLEARSSAIVVASNKRDRRGMRSTSIGAFQCSHGPYYTADHPGIALALPIMTALFI